MIAPPPDEGPPPPPAWIDWVAPLGRAVAFAIAVPVSLLPARWRARVEEIVPLPMGAGAVASGSVQAVGAIFSIVFAFQDFLGNLAAEAGGVAAAAAVEGHVSDMGQAYRIGQVQGAAIWFMFLVTPGALVRLYFLAEGLVRAAVAPTAGEVVGTFPLWAVERLLALGRRAHDRARETGPIADEIARDEGRLLIRIDSCRPRPWDRLSTLGFEERLYVIASYEHRAGQARPHVYHLAEAPPGHLVRKILPYAPDELLPRKGRPG